MEGKRQSSYDTNLASEFFVMSVLHRLGMEAHLTLANKKAVDIVVVRAPGDTLTIDVKAVTGKVDWLVGNPPSEAKQNHFVVLVTYDGGFSNLKQQPRVWVLPHQILLPLIRRAKAPSKMKYVRRLDITGLDLYSEAWDLIRR